MHQRLKLCHTYFYFSLTFSKELPKTLGAGLLPSPLAVAAAMAAAASSNQLALRPPGPTSHPHPHHHLLQGTPLSLLRPAPGPIRTTHGPILFTPYWWRENEDELGRSTLWSGGLQPCAIKSQISWCFIIIKPANINMTLYGAYCGCRPLLLRWQGEPEITDKSQTFQRDRMFPSSPVPLHHSAICQSSSTLCR